VAIRNQLEADCIQAKQRIPVAAKSWEYQGRRFLLKIWIFNEQTCWKALWVFVSLHQALC